MFRINPSKTSREEKQNVNGKHSCGKNQKAKVSVKEIQKKYQPKDAKPKKVGTRESLVTPKLRKLRFLLRWSPTGKLFNQEGKLVDSIESKRNLKLLINFIWKFMGTVRLGNDHVAAILGFGDLQAGNILITRVYFVEGLGYNLFSVGQFCDSDLEVAFRRNACFVRNLEGVDLLKGDRSTNLYTINLHEMSSTSPICLMAHASSTKSWLWHQRLSYLNFDTINDLASNDLVVGLPKFKYHKEHLCPSCEKCKSKRASHPPKPRYILLIVDDYSRYTWVHFLRSKDEAPDVIVKFLKRITVLLQSPVIIIRTDNGTEFKNHVLKEYFDTVDIGKLGAKGDIGFFIGYSADSCAYRVYNRRTKKIMETMNVSFDELSAMAFEQRSSKPGLNSMTYGHISSGLDLTYAPSRPNIVHATCLCARYQAKLTEKHLKEVKRIFCYLWRTVNTGLWYTKDSGFELTGFSDANYAGCKDTFKSTSGGAQFLAIAISCNPIQHSRTKHIVVRYHFIKEHVEKGTIELYFVKTDYQLADIFTKALPADRFNYLVHRLGMRSLSPKELERLAKSQ
nr:retrovirus-related Pol polyprotein from transposon TNT 1-94 [Tanacetum cinerariifolium]